MSSRGWRRPGPLVRQCGPGAARTTQGRRDAAVVDLAPDREHDRSRQPPWQCARPPAGDRGSKHSSDAMRAHAACHFPAPAVAKATAASTSSRWGRPLARRVTWPCGPSTKTVGVRRTSSSRTRSSRSATSISTCVTPGSSAATSASSCLAARQGAQKDEENWSSVARVPSGWPSSAPVSDACRVPWSRPSRRRRANATTVASTTTVATAIAPASTPVYSTAGPGIIPGRRALRSQARRPPRDR